MTDKLLELLQRYAPLVGALPLLAYYLWSSLHVRARLKLELEIANMMPEGSDGRRRLIDNAERGIAILLDEVEQHRWRQWRWMAVALAGLGLSAWGFVLDQPTHGPAWQAIYVSAGVLYLLSIAITWFNLRELKTRSA